MIPTTRREYRAALFHEYARVRLDPATIRHLAHAPRAEADHAYYLIAAEAQRLHDTLTPHDRGNLARTARTLHTATPLCKAGNHRECTRHTMGEKFGGGSASPRARARVGRLVGSVGAAASAIGRAFTEIFVTFGRAVQALGWQGVFLWVVAALAIGLWLWLIGSGLSRP